MIKFRKFKFIEKKFKNKTHIAKSFEEILTNKNIKNIILATHPSVNFNLGKKVLDNNKNLFVEKPIVSNIKKLHKLIKCADFNKKF